MCCYVIQTDCNLFGHVMVMSFFKLAAECLLKIHNNVIVGCYVSVTCVCCLFCQISQCCDQTLKLLPCICTNLFLQFHFRLHAEFYCDQECMTYSLTPLFKIKRTELSAAVFVQCGAQKFSGVQKVGTDCQSC